LCPLGFLCKHNVSHAFLQADKLGAPGFLEQAGWGHIRIGAGRTLFTE